MPIILFFHYIAILIFKIYLFTRCVCVHVLCLQTRYVLVSMDVKSQKRWSKLELRETVELLHVRSGNWSCVPRKNSKCSWLWSHFSGPWSELKRILCVCFVSVSLCTLRLGDNFVVLRLSFYLYRGSSMESMRSSLCGSLDAEQSCWPQTFINI